MKKLFVTKGLPASGKSTWSKIEAESVYESVIVNRDSIRTMLKGEYRLFPFGSSMEKLVTDIEMSAMQSALARGCNVILDSTGFRFNLSAEYVKEMYDAKLIIVDFTNVPLEECIRRDSEREYPVGKKVIEGMYNKYLKK